MALDEIGTTSRGYTIYVEEAEQGPRYVSDEIGGGCVIWDTAIAHPDSLEIAIKHFRDQGVCCRLSGRYKPSEIDAANDEIEKLRLKMKLIKCEPDKRG